MIEIEPKDVSVPEFHRYLLGGVAPRPIALVSTVSEDGIHNLSPFSFFNAFGANPPVVAFSAARRGRDGSLKDTYKNLVETKECVIQAVTYSMVEQISLASSEFGPEENEFIKAGLTSVNSDMVKPQRVKESPFQMECILRDMHCYGEKGGSANLAVCEVLKLHIDENVIKNGVIEPKLIDLVARMSADYYCRANGDAIFVVEKPGRKIGMGFDNLPEFIKNSDIFTGNDLAKFAGAIKIPYREELNDFKAQIENIEIDFDKDLEKSFGEQQREGNYKLMLKVALLLQTKVADCKKYFEYSSKRALDLGDLDFAWKSIMLFGTK